METIYANVRELPPVWEIGTKVYIIQNTSSKSFEEKCPMCEDMKNITYKGFTVPCPLCSSRKENVKNITIRKYEVVELIVNGYEISGPENKSCYKGERQFEQRSLPMIKNVKAFAKSDAGWNSIMSMTIPTYKDRFDPAKDVVMKSLKISDYIFTSKKKAEEAKEKEEA